MTTTEKRRAEETPEFVDHTKAAVRATVRQWKSLLPDDFWTYGREARHEFVLALRSAVNTMIDRLEPSAEEKTPPKPRSARKAKVEVE